MFTLLFAPLVLAPRQTTTDLVRNALIHGPAVEVRLEGSATYFGCPSKFSFQIGPNGEFVHSVAGPLGDSFGSDGKSLWQTDRTGAPRALAMEDGDVNTAIAMLLSDRWLDKASGLALEAPTDPGSQLDAVMQSGFRIHIVLDQLHRPKSAWFDTTDGTIRLSLSDWRPVEGRVLPFHSEVTTAGLTDVFQADSASRKEGDYRKPAWTPADATFDPSKPVEVESKRAPTGHILVHPTINGKDVGWFILDTGAGEMVIDPKVADKIGLEKVGKQPVTGVGGTITSSFRVGGVVSLGQVTIKDVAFAELDLSSLSSYFGVQLAGVVGYDLFRRSIVSINFGKLAVSISDPSKYALPQNAGWSEMKFDSGNPIVEATCEGNLKGWYRLDTGDPSTVTFHSPFVEKNHLLDGRKTVGASSGGVGGFVGAKSGTIGWFELGNHKFENPQVTFSLAKKGALSNRYLAGNIGQGFMSPFEMAFDFGGSRVAFVPIKPS